MPEKDKRLIFIEAMEPFLSSESRSQVACNIDIIEQRLANEGYWSRLVQRFQKEIEELKIENHELGLRGIPQKCIKTQTSSQACPVCKSDTNWNYCKNCGQKISY